MYVAQKKATIVLFLLSQFSVKTTAQAVIMEKMRRETQGKVQYIVNIYIERHDDIISIVRILFLLSTIFFTIIFCQS